MRTLFLVLSFILVVSAITSEAHGINQYLGSSNSSCERGRIELYTELRGEDGKYSYHDGDNDPNNSYNTYDDDINGTIGLRFSWPLQSTCNNDTIDLLRENDRLRQELELLSVCGKYKELELGAEFSTVREMCKGVNKVK